MSARTGTARPARRRGNPAFLTGGRLYPRAVSGFTSERAFLWLSTRIGRSAATTYISQREWGGMTVLSALIAARMQVQALGVAYPGGMECTVFRADRMPRFEALIDKSSASELTALELAVLELHVVVAGYCIEGPGDPDYPELHGRFWWSLGRAGWSGYDVAFGDWATRGEALLDAARFFRREFTDRPGRPN